jgi:hypothetical protein
MGASPDFPSSDSPVMKPYPFQFTFNAFDGWWIRPHFSESLIVFRIQGNQAAM